MKMSGGKKVLVWTKWKILYDVTDGIFKKSETAARYRILASTLSTIIKNQEQMKIVCIIN